VTDCKRCAELASTSKNRRQAKEAPTGSGRENDNKPTDSESQQTDEDENEGEDNDSTAHGFENLSPRLRPIFAGAPLLKKLSGRIRSSISLAKQAEETATYKLVHEGKPRKEYSGFLLEACEYLDAISPECPCPNCRGVEGSLENDIYLCPVCGGKGYLTVEEVQEAK
jgi:hypothetical protein